MFREALGYPTRSPEGGRSIIVGGLLLVSLTICYGIASLETPYAYAAIVGLLPWLLVRGYYVRVIRTTIGRSNPTPPRFDDVRTLLTDGAIAMWIAILYLLPGVAILGPLVGIQVLEYELSELLTTAGLTESAIQVTIPLIGLIAVFALMSLLGALYVLPVAVTRYAYSGEWRQAIGLRTVIDGAVTEDYAIAWGVSLVIQALFLPIAYVLRVVLLGFFLHFLVAVGVRYCYGQGVGSALDLDPVGAARARMERGEKSSESGSDLRPAITRVDTSEWGVPPGADPDPMTKSAHLNLNEDREPKAETVDREDRAVERNVDREEGRDEPEEEELPSAIERISDDERQ